jgi:hypothetical protein
MAAKDIIRMTEAEHREFASFARMYGAQWKKQMRQRRMNGRLEGPALSAFNKIGPSGLIAYRLTMANPMPRKRSSAAMRYENPSRRPVDHKFAGSLFSAGHPKIALAYLGGSLTKTTARDLAASKKRKR